jgi:hypothetical protein
MGEVINVRHKDDVHIFKSERTGEVIVTVYYNTPVDAECAKCGRISGVDTFEFSMNQEELKLVIAELSALIKKEE